MVLLFIFQDVLDRPPCLLIIPYFSRKSLGLTRAFPFDQLDLVDIALPLPLDLVLKLRLHHCVLRRAIPAKTSKEKMDRGDDHEQRDLPV
jgi:hypothetical protein